MKSNTGIKPIVLIVDNLESYRHSLRSILELNGYRVKEADSVEQARRKLKRGAVDLALIDLRMTHQSHPNDISGLAVADFANRYGIPRIIITAFPSVEAARNALASRGSDPPRASDLVPKSNGPKGVLAAMRKVKSLGHIVILHISDLHFGAPSDRIPYNQQLALRKIKDDLKTLRADKRIGRVNTIVVSGDISFQCRREGFDQALEFLRELCRDLHIRKEHVIIVPGNHDIERKRATEALKSHLRERGNEDVLFEKFTHYLKFTEQWYGQTAFRRDKLYKIFDLGRVVLVAFNSCYREGNTTFRCAKCWLNGKHEHYHGWVDDRQIEQVRTDLESLLAGREALCIGIVHHHLGHAKHSRCKGDHLWDYDKQLKSAFREMGLRFLLHGHGHVADAIQENTPGPWPYILGAGTLRFSPKPGKEKNQYLILDLSPEGWRALIRRYEQPDNDDAGDWIADSSIETHGIVDPQPARLPAL